MQSRKPQSACARCVRAFRCSDSQARFTLKVVGVPSIRVVDSSRAIHPHAIHGIEWMCTHDKGALLILQVHVHSDVFEVMLGNENAW